MRNDDTGSMIYHFPVESGYILDGYNAQFSGIAQEISEMLDSLTQRERNVLKMRFGFCGGSCMSLEETGGCMNVTRERIRQIEAKSLRKLRHSARSKKIEVYVECVGQPLPNWIWTTGMHVYERFYEAENISVDTANPLTPLPWKGETGSVDDFEKSLREEKTTAILKRIGYDVRQPEEERHAIIQYAISVCGISKVYKCLKAMAVIRAYDLTSAYREDWIYVVRNRESLAALSFYSEDTTGYLADVKQEETKKEWRGGNAGTGANTYPELESDFFKGLNPESFLKQLGYSTFIPEEERHDILTYAMRMYGQNRIFGLLRFFIAIHKSDEKMQRACKIWMDDLEACLEQCTD